MEWNKRNDVSFRFAHFITNTRSTITLLFSFRIREPIKQFIENMKTFIQYLQFAIILKIKMNVAISNITRAMTTSKHVAD